jgi:hypothetical protein
MRVFVTGGTGFVGSPAADPVRFAEIDSGAIAALGEALAGTGKPLVAAAGLPTGSTRPGCTAWRWSRRPPGRC